MNNWKHVYVLLSKNGNVKIGVSKNVMKRICTIEGASGYKIKDYFITEKCSNYCEIEKMAHKHFQEYRLFGEWFKIDFDDAVNIVRGLYESKSQFLIEDKSCCDSSELLKLLHTNAPFSNESEFSEEFIDMAIELGEKMKEIKMLKEEIERKTR